MVSAIADAVTRPLAPDARASRRRAPGAAGASPVRPPLPPLPAARRGQLQASFEQAERQLHEASGRLLVLSHAQGIDVDAVALASARRACARAARRYRLAWEALAA